MQTTRRKLPAYAKALIKDESGISFLYFGSKSWTASKCLGSCAVILPPNDPPQDFNWSFFAGQVVIGIEKGDSEKEYRRRLAGEILIAGAVQVDIFLDKETAKIEDRGYSVKINGVDFPVIYEFTEQPHERFKRGK